MHVWYFFEEYPSQKRIALFMRGIVSETPVLLRIIAVSLILMKERVPRVLVRRVFSWIRVGKARALTHSPSGTTSDVQSHSFRTWAPTARQETLWGIPKIHPRIVVGVENTLH
jgi:hypothetical protein